MPYETYKYLSHDPESLTIELHTIEIYATLPKHLDEKANIDLAKPNYLMLWSESLSQEFLNHPTNKPSALILPSSTWSDVYCLTF